MASVIRVRSSFLPIDSIRLGRFVRYREQPQSDFLDPECQSSPETIVIPRVHYSEVQQSAGDGNLVALLTGLVSASWSKKRKDYTQVTSSKVTEYQMNNSGAWFKNAIKLQSTREWMTETLEQGKNVYVVVGYYTMLDAEVVEASADMVNSRGGVQLPVTGPLSAVGFAVREDNVLDVRVNGANIDQRGVQRRFVVAGEQICGVQYRKVQFKILSGRNLDKTSLQEGCWTMYSGVRGDESEAGEDVEDDIVFADLEDDEELDIDFKVCKSEKYGKFVL